MEIPVKINHGIHYFTRPDDNKNINWNIRVKLWKGFDDKQEVAHRVVYECIAKFSTEEQSWLRLINSGHVRWNRGKQDPNNVNHFITKPEARPQLRAWVKPLLDEVGVETVEAAGN